MDDDATRLQLKEFFPGIEEEALIKCISMCRMFNLAPDDLRFKWEALIFNTSAKDTPITFFTLDSARDLQQILQREVAKPVQKVVAPKHNAVKKVFRQVPLGGGVAAGSPTATSTRRKQGMVKKEPSALAGPSVNFTPPHNIEAYSYRYMHEKMYDRAAILDDQIDDMAEIVKKHYQLEELGDPNTVTQDEVVVVGRIVNDGDTKLGESSTFLESSRMMGMGVRVPLEFDADVKIRCASMRGTGSTGIGLFPGMIVALKGKNGSGDSFVVSEFLRIPPLFPSIKTDTDSSLKAMVACGPYTCDSDLDYKPFTALIDAVRNERPQLLLLIGPFVDSNHPLVKTGQLDQTPASVFREHISNLLVQLEGDIPELLVIVVPNTRDLISSHVVFPQAAPERDPELGLPRRAHLVPNPSIFSINGFNIGVTSVDVLFHIRKDEFFKHAPELSDERSSQPTDAMAMLCRQILEQRSFYPLFPVPKEVQEDVNLSVVHSKLLKMDEIAPDLLVLPSRLKAFQKVVDSTVIVNPAMAAKSNSAGTAVCLEIIRSPGAAPHCSTKPIKLGT